MPKKSNSMKMLAAILLQLLPPATYAQIIRVPLNQPTIQAAIDSAKNGDVIKVHSGTYYETINFHGKAISVKSEGGPRPTIIDGKSKETVVTFVSGEGLTSLLSGFTIRNGRSGFDTVGFGDGGGIRIEASSPTIKNNVIINNGACSGAGISISFGSPLIQRNLIANNVQEGCSGGIGGGGISIAGAAEARILDNIIEDNAMSSSDGGGISMFAAGSPTISGNIIRRNKATGLSPCASGGGISMVNQSDATIVQNLIRHNTAGCGGGIYWLVPFGARGPFLINNTIANNIGEGVFADGYDANSRLINNIIVTSADQTALFCGDFNDQHDPIIHFNDIFSQGGIAYGGKCRNRTGKNGNISADPLFISVEKRNYHLQKSSPAIDAGSNKTPNLPITDIDGAKRIQDGNLDGIAVIDMGFDEFTPQVEALTASSSTNNDNSYQSFPAPLSPRLFSDDIHEISADSQSAVFAYDAAGHVISHTDANGIKHKYTRQH